MQLNVALNANAYILAFGATKRVCLIPMELITLRVGSRRHFLIDNEITFLCLFDLKN